MVAAAIMRAQLETIAKRLSDGYTDAEIMRDLKIKRTSFYSCKSKIFKQYGDLAARKLQQSLEFEAEVLKDRYIRLYRQLELKMNDKDESLADTAMAAEIAAFIATNIFKLEVEGLRARQGQRLASYEQKAIRYIQALPTEVSERDYAAVNADPSTVEHNDGSEPDPTTQSKVF